MNDPRYRKYEATKERYDERMQQLQRQEEEKFNEDEWIENYKNEPERRIQRDIDLDVSRLWLDRKNPNLRKWEKQYENDDDDDEWYDVQDEFQEPDIIPGYNNRDMSLPLDYEDLPNTELFYDIDDRPSTWYDLIPKGIPRNEDDEEEGKKVPEVPSALPWWGVGDEHRFDYRNMPVHSTPPLPIGQVAESRRIGVRPRRVRRATYEYKDILRKPRDFAKVMEARYIDDEKKSL